MKLNRKRNSKGASKLAPQNIPARDDRTVTVGIETSPATSEPRNAPPEMKSETALRPESEMVRVDFKLFHPRAERVSLCSEFNGWSPEATPLNRAGDGCWSVTLGLKPGRYQYKFLVDGQWIADPQAKENLFNQFGTLNSVVEIQA